MTKAPESEWVSPNPWHEVEDIYLKALDHLGKGETELAVRLALHLSRLLERLDPNCEAMLGMAGRGLIAELDGDLPEAIRYKKMEIAGVKKLLDELDSKTLDLMAMGPDDYSDQLDLLACLYLDAGRYDDALQTLEDSEAYCEVHGIPFDGKDIRADVKRAMRRRKKAKAG